MRRYIKIWWILTTAAAQNSFTSRTGAAILIVGKLLRFGLFFFFLFLIGSRTKLIGGYTLQQLIVFFLSFQLIDLLPQFFLREVYRFRQYIVTGDFDYFLVKPISALFRGLFGGADPLDIPIIIFTFIFLGFAVNSVAQGNILHIALYIFFLVNALAIALACHIAILALGVITTEIDSAVLLYRDLTMMGRIPIDLYKEPLRGFLTFVIPVAIMMTIPAKVLLGLTNPLIMIIAVLISTTLVFGSIKLWQYSLRQYSSASS